jgi:hypothetical protein
LIFQPTIQIQVLCKLYNVTIRWFHPVSCDWLMWSYVLITICRTLSLIWSWSCAQNVTSTRQKRCYWNW